MKVLLIILGIVLYLVIGFVVTTWISILLNETPGPACIFAILGWPVTAVAMGLVKLNNGVDNLVLYVARNWKNRKKGE